MRTVYFEKVRAVQESKVKFHNKVLNVQNLCAVQHYKVKSHNKSLKCSVEHTEIDFLFEGL